MFSSINGMLLPFRAKISYMSGEYSDEWAELRRLRRRVLTVVFAGAAILVLVPLVSTFALRAAAKAIGLALFAAWVLVLFRFSGTPLNCSFVLFSPQQTFGITLSPVVVALEKCKAFCVFNLPNLPSLLGFIPNTSTPP